MRDDITTGATSGSPFLDIPSFTPVVAPAAEVSHEAMSPPSPFKAVYRTEDFEESADPETEEVMEFLFEMHDRDFEDAIVQVAGEIQDLVGMAEYGGPQMIAARERMLGQHLAPLTMELDRLVDHLADTADARGTALMEPEIDEIIDGFATETALQPSFEHLFGGLKKKFKKLAKKGYKLAKAGLKAAATLGFGPIIRKLRGKLGKLLIKILEKAIGKLPIYLQPVARKLYKRYAGKLLHEAEFEADDGEDAVSDPTRMQLEIDQYLTYFVFADHEHEQDMLLAEMEAEALAADPMDELYRAREHFVAELSELEADADPAPAVERFLPAVWPLLKVGVKVGGRKRILDTLSRHLGKLIGKFVGRRYSRPLSRAVIDLGLKYAGLEVSEDETRSVGAEAVAFTVEDTVRRLVALPDTALQNEETLEADTVAAFEAAAAAYLPDVLQDRVYAARPDLRESCDRPSFWVGMPLREPRKFYRKLTGGVSDVAVCPHTLGRIRTWRGQTLAAHLRNRVGVDVGRGFTARVYLFEVMPGGSLQDIARADPDLRTAGRAPAWMLLHPLTREAAGMLLREPGLGRDVPARYLDQPSRTPAVGQRFYYLRHPDATPQVFTAAGRLPALRRPSEVSLCLDLMKGRFSVDLFLSEARAQEIATSLRSGIHPATIATTLRPLVSDGIRAALTGGMHHRVRILHTSLPPEHADGRALGWLPSVAVERLAAALSDWVGRGLASGIGAEARPFVEATEADADGTTIRLTFANPPGLAKIRAALAGNPVRVREQWFEAGYPDASVQSLAGAG